jgi:HlyD family secretion protein
MKKKGIFREVALDRLSSPEQLDQVIRITTPRAWLGLGSFLLLVVSVVTWGVLGEVSQKIKGRGMLIRSGGVLEVVSPVAGRVTDRPVSVGDSVREGEVVAWLSKPDLVDRVRRAEAELEDVKELQEEKLAFAREEARLRRKELEQQRAAVEANLRADTARLQTLSGQLEVREELVEDGLMARSSLLATREKLDRTREQLRSRQRRLLEIRTKTSQVEDDLRRAEHEARSEIERARREVEWRRESLSEASRVVSPYSGRILEVFSEMGGLVRKGEAVVSLDRTGKSVEDLLVVVYVPSIHGKKVEAGMPIHVSPSTVRREEHGMMVGTVTFVSDYPATGEGMMGVLENDQLVRELSAGGTPYEVHARLELDADSPDHYEWTSSGEVPQRVESGTVAAAEITVARQRPASLVLPILREWTGL